MNSPQQFRLHWKNHSPNFVTVFTQLLNSESLVDVTLAADGKQIQAHRVVLSACSSYFKELFISHPCQHPIVLLKDVNFKDLCTVIHFMYYGEVNIEQDQINSILKTAEALHVKGFADKADREFLAAALLLNEDQPSSPFSENQLESDDAESCSNNKRPRNESNEDHSKSNHEQLLSPELKRKFFQTSGDDTISSCRSSSSFENTSVIKSQSSIVDQNSLEMDQDTCYDHLSGKPERVKNLPANTRQNGTPVAGSGNSNANKTKRNRPLLRQERVRKEIEKDHQTLSENERSSPTVSTFQHILPKSAIEATELKCAVQTYRQLAPSTQLMNKQRSQTILPSPPGGGGTLLPISTCAPPTTAAQSLSILSPSNIPTLAVTPVSSTTPNIVIDQYPTILRVVSFEEMNVHTEIQTQSATPGLAQRSAQSGSGTSNTLQVPTIVECLPESSSRGSSHGKVREENLRRSVSNPGLSGPSGGGTVQSTTGHCPVLRTGAALGCNYCWNTVDERGRILRRKTKYHCPDCQANLCIVPCFQDYHEKFVSSSEGQISGSHSKGPTHQLLPKMSSI